MGFLPTTSNLKSCCTEIRRGRLFRKFILVSPVAWDTSTCKDKNMSNWFNGLMGKATAPTQGQSVATLLDRVQNATTNEDRRKAIADLRSMAETPAHIKVRDYFHLFSEPIRDFRSISTQKPSFFINRSFFVNSDLHRRYFNLATAFIGGKYLFDTTIRP